MNQQLGKLVGQVLHELGACDRFLDDPMTEATGTQELLPLVARASNARIKVLLGQAGYTPREFAQEVEERTTPKWAYYYGFTTLKHLGCR